jgi:hypothetical protein
MFDRLNLAVELRDLGTIEARLRDDLRANPDEAASERRGKAEPAERAGCPSLPKAESEQAHSRTNAEECLPLDPCIKGEPRSNAAAKTDDRPGWKLRAFGLEELLQPLKKRGNPRLPIAPSTLWKRRFPYVRGARPLHCSIERRGKRA